MDHYRTAEPQSVSINIAGNIFVLQLKYILVILILSTTRIGDFIARVRTLFRNVTGRGRAVHISPHAIRAGG